MFVHKVNKFHLMSVYTRERNCDFVSFEFTFVFFYFRFLYSFSISKYRICPIRRSIGMRPVSYATNVVYRWLTNNSVRKLRRSTAATVMTHNSHHVAMAVEKCFVLVCIHKSWFLDFFGAPFYISPVWAFLPIPIFLSLFACGYYLLVSLSFSLSLFFFHNSHSHYIIN